MKCERPQPHITVHWSLRRRLFAVLLVLIITGGVSVAQELPPGGTTSWEIDELEVIVTFLLFDPDDPEISLPKGLRFILAHEIEAPEFQAHLTQYPWHSDWAFSFVEFVRPTDWSLDGIGPRLPENGAIGVWFAPVDHSQLSSEIREDKFETVIAPSDGGILVLGLWIPDREYADYMRVRGHHAQYGMVTLAKDGHGAFQGQIQLTGLNIKASASPHGEIRNEPDPFTQVFFEPGEKVGNVVVLAGTNVRERDCTAEWSGQGDHPLSRGVFLGLTFHVMEGPLKGSAYRIGDN